MPRYDFTCEPCEYSEERFLTFDDFDSQKTKQLCPKCGTAMANEIPVVHVPAQIPGCASADLAAEKDMERYQAAQADLDANGMSQMEVEEGIAGMQDYEKKHGLEPGSVTNKRDNNDYVGVKQPDGSVGVKLSPEAEAKSKKEAKAKVKKSKEMRKSSLGRDT